MTCYCYLRETAFVAVTPVEQPVEKLLCVEWHCSRARRQRSHEVDTGMVFHLTVDDIRGPIDGWPCPGEKHLLSSPHPATTEHQSRYGSREEKEQIDQI